MIISSAFLFLQFVLAAFLATLFIQSHCLQIYTYVCFHKNVLHGSLFVQNFSCIHFPKFRKASHQLFCILSYDSVLLIFISIILTTNKCLDNLRKAICNNTDFAKCKNSRFMDLLLIMKVSIALCFRINQNGCKQQIL